MSSLRDFSTPPYSGLTAQEIISALQSIQANTDFCDRPIIAVAARDDGRVMVKTGEMRGMLSGGGLIVFLSRNEDGWEIYDSGGWAS